MPSIRKDIRDDVKARIATQYTGQIYTTRRVDARELDEFVTVFLGEGEYASAGFEITHKAELGIGIFKTGNASDDELDAIADLVDTALEEDFALDDGVFLLAPTGFEYPDDSENQFSSLILKYKITY
jgi:hypothetical protein